MNTAVIYARVSSTNDRQDTSRQVSDLQNYAKANALHVANTYEEHISGAKHNNERPILQECLDYCINNDIDILLVSELSRLGRNVDEVWKNCIFCKEHHLNVYFQKEGFQILQDDGKENPFTAIFIAVIGTCASIERENISYRLNSGLRKYIQEGGKVGRHKGQVKSKETMEREYAKVIRLLRQGESIRNTATICGLSTNTVLKVKRTFINDAKEKKGKGGKE